MQKAKNRSLVQPTPGEIKKARQVVGLTQTAAGALIYAKMRTWQDWEAGKAAMHLGLWELFLIKKSRLDGENSP